MNIDLGNVKGVTRKLPNDYRLSIPKELFNMIGVNKLEEVEMFCVENGIYIKKYENK